MNISELQRHVKNLVGEKDKEVGKLFLFSVLSEEVGELAKAIRRDDAQRVAEELADVIFCSLSLANLYDIQIEETLKSKYIGKSLEQISSKWIDVPWKK